MSVVIDMGGAVGSLDATCTQLRVTLPGGLAVQGSAPHLGASPLEASRATISALNSALAPLGPVFSIIDAVLAIVKFAQTVPKVLTRPDKVVSALVDVVQKAGKLASLVPQLSVPLMIVGCIDVLIAFLQGISTEVSSLAAFATRAETVADLAASVPALQPIVDDVNAQIESRRAQIACGVGDAQPLLGIIGVFCDLIGIPSPTLDVDAGAGSLDDLADALATTVHALVTVRSAIPV